MKRFLLLSLLLCLNTIAIAQTTWTGEGANANWNNTDNWDTNMVPTASDDVIIPTGFTVTLSSPANVKSIDVQGNAVINKTQVLNITNASTIGANAIINWHTGNLDGGGTLTNNGTINTFNGNWNVTGTATLINNGTINLTGSGDIGIGTDSVINNTVLGTIDFQGDTANFLGAGAAPRVLINTGTIKTTFADPTDTALISVEFKNNNGTVQVEAGTLNLSNATVDGMELTDGIYNVFAGAALDFANSKTTISGTLTGNLVGDLNWNGDVRVNSSNTSIFDFTGHETVSWRSGTLVGGGTLVNEGIIVTPTSSNLVINEATTLTNNNTINLTGTGGIFIGTNSVIDNTASGTIDFQGDGSEISPTGVAPRVLNNAGTIKTTLVASTDAATIRAEFKNNDGIIQVEGGTLNLSNATVDAIELTDGTYHVFSGAAFDFDGSVTLLGTLRGNLTGDLNWRGDIRVNSADMATFDFTGNAAVSWLSGTLVGGGTLVNEDVIVTPTSSNLVINEATTLTNNNMINLTGTGDIFIGTNSIINNSSSGIIDLQTDNSAVNATGAAPNVLNNAGLLKGSAPSIVRIGAEMNNSGTIEVASGTLLFNGILNHQATGIAKGIATLDLPTDVNFTNDGTFAPGASPGILSVIGNFKSSSTSVLDVEIDGLLQGTEYDLLDIEGTNVIFDGSINVTMGFEGTIGDEFIIATTTGTISQCTLAPTTSAIHNGMQYHFNVACRNDNEVVLTLANITLGLDDFELNEHNIVLYPNPVKNLLTIKNEKQLELVNAEILDVTGKVITAFDLKNMGLSQVISLENYSSGMYFLRINAQNDSVIKRLIKQ